MEETLLSTSIVSPGAAMMIVCCRSGTTITLALLYSSICSPATMYCSSLCSPATKAAREARPPAGGSLSSRPVRWRWRGREWALESARSSLGLTRRGEGVVSSLGLTSLGRPTAEEAARSSLDLTRRGEARSSLDLTRRGTQYPSTAVCKNKWDMGGTIKPPLGEGMHRICYSSTY